MDRKRHMLICFFISMLVDNERGEIVVKISKVVTTSMHLSHSSLQEFMAFQAVELAMSTLIKNLVNLTKCH
jgi:hypothetical protein